MPYGTHGICSSQPISSPIQSPNLPKPKNNNQLPINISSFHSHKSYHSTNLLQESSLLSNQPKCPSASSPPAQRQQHSAPPHPPAYSQQQRHSRRQRRRRRKRQLKRQIRQLVRRACLLLRRAVRHSLPSLFLPFMPFPFIPPSSTVTTLIPTASPLKSQLSQRLTRPTEQASQAIKSSVGMGSKEAAGSAKEMTGEAKGKASEMAGEAKGKASELSGTAKGMAE